MQQGSSEEHKQEGQTVQYTTLSLSLFLLPRRIVLFCFHIISRTASFVGRFQELSVYLHSVSCVESWAYVVCKFREPNRTREGRVSERDAPNKSLFYIWYISSFFLFERMWWTLRQKFSSESSCALSCCFMIRERSAVLVLFQGLGTSPFLWEEGCARALCTACHIQWFTRKVHALKVCMSAHLDHGHMQHKS